jgi:superoxide reductase
MEKGWIYRCSECGNLVGVLHVGGGTLTCCDRPMVRLEENTVDAAREKHVPVLERASGGLAVRVGSVSHPMTEAHRIAWIEVEVDGLVVRKDLEPGDAPEAFFPLDGRRVAVRAWCNLHGLWKA